MKSHFMAHDLKPILLIDDKMEGENRGVVFVQSLPNDLKKLVDLHIDVNQLFKKTDEWSVKLLFDPNKYAGVILHHSYKDPILKEPQLSDLRDKLRILDLVIFSGGKVVDSSSKKVSRDVLFKYLKPALDAYSKIQVFPIAYLFIEKINRFYPIINEMNKILEDEGKDALLSHKSFKLYAAICGWDLNAVQKNYKEKYSEVQIADKIMEWKLNFNQ